MYMKAVVLCMVLGLPWAMAGQSSSAANPSTPANQQLSNSDKAFLKALIQEDTSEIQLAHMALEKSKDPQVKQYAESKILAADPGMKEGAEHIAQEHGIQPPTGPGARKQDVAAELSKKSGRVFDNAYMIYEATQQPGDLELVNTEAKSTQNSEMKKYVAIEKKPVEEAAESAVQVSKQISTGLTHYKQGAQAK